MNSGDWNIPVDGAGDRNLPNDPNRSGWKQIQSLVVSGLIPAVSMALVGHFIKRYNDQQHHLEAVLELNKQRPDVVKKQEILNKMKNIEDSREGERQEIVKTIRSKYPTILDILDIACSEFKSKNSRTPLQNDLLSQVSNPKSKIVSIHMAEGLPNIFENDKQFAGSNRSENGKLWRVYAQLWEEKAEKRKYESAWQDLRQYFENQKK